MSVIRQRKKNLIKASFVGGMIVFIPLMIVILGISSLLYHKNKALKIESNYAKMESYQFTHNISANSIVKDEDLKKVILKVEENTKIKQVLRSDIIGKRVKLDSSEDTLVTKDMLYEGNLLENDLRLHHYNFIKLDDKLKEGDYVDIRISYPNGADFILLSKKKVVDLSFYNLEKNTQNTLWMQVSEEEILRISSAIVDAYNIGGCSIYAIHYIDEVQEASVVTYPVNDIVSNLMKEDPNIVMKATNVLESKLRKELELEAMYGEESYYGEQEIQAYHNNNNAENTNQGNSILNSRTESHDTTNSDNEIEYVD